MKSPEEIKKLIDERERKLETLHKFTCGRSNDELDEHFKWVLGRVQELINELVLLKEIYYG